MRIPTVKDTAAVAVIAALSGGIAFGLLAFFALLGFMRIEWQNLLEPAFYMAVGSSLFICILLAYVAMAFAFAASVCCGIVITVFHHALKPSGSFMFTLFVLFGFFGGLVVVYLMGTEPPPIYVLSMGGVGEVSALVSWRYYVKAWRFREEEPRLEPWRETPGWLNETRT